MSTPCYHVIQTSTSPPCTAARCSVSASASALSVPPRADSRRQLVAPRLLSTSLAWRVTERLWQQQLHPASWGYSARRQRLLAPAPVVAPAAVAAGRRARTTRMMHPAGTCWVTTARQQRRPGSHNCSMNCCYRRRRRCSSSSSSSSSQSPPLRGLPLRQPRVEAPAGGALWGAPLAGNGAYARWSLRLRMMTARQPWPWVAVAVGRLRQR